MSTVFEKNRCCGCSACSKICPVGAITMIEDEEGFLYPEINVFNVEHAIKFVHLIHKQKSKK